MLNLISRACTVLHNQPKHALSRSHCVNLIFSATFRDDVETLTGCQYDWCSEIGAITVVQFMFGYVCSLLGYPFCIALCGSIFTKVLGPVPQVGPIS